MRRPSSTVREGFQTKTFLVRSNPSWSSLFPSRGNSKLSSVRAVRCKHNPLIQCYLVVLTSDSCITAARTNPAHQCTDSDPVHQVSTHPVDYTTTSTHIQCTSIPIRSTTTIPVIIPSNLGDDKTINTSIRFTTTPSLFHRI